MNKLILDQLQKCEHCKLPEYDADTTKIFIPKHSIKKELTLELNHCYQIEIADYVLNPTEGFTLSQNWNGGTNPPTKVMNICVIQIMGKMFKVDGIGFDDVLGSPINKSWSGWLPQTAIKISGEI